MKYLQYIGIMIMLSVLAGIGVVNIMWLTKACELLYDIYLKVV
jgi:hypothetical protein